MKSGSIVIAKVPDEQVEWAYNADGQLKNCCLWFNNFNTVQKQLASVVRSYITDTVPQLIYEEAKKCPEPYTEDETKKAIIDVVGKILGRRKEEMQQLINNIENGNGKEE
jgi:hypothetical protein